ncbi:MAG: hypothetical protein A2V67_07005 [Deltaproteobacteria bacterium RBG_13_61_14]|nr:MAG: hypothetical protein A2V67_07005 [Deltaproteobacteria bacterium RBG_13_61_14]
MSETWATIATFFRPIDAHLACSHLEAAGIEALILDENTASINPFYSIAIGGCRVQVREKELTRAQEVLGADSMQVMGEDSEDDSSIQIKKPSNELCPQCGALGLASEKQVSWLAALLSLISGHSMPLAKKVFRCQVCGAVWRPPSSSSGAGHPRRQV